MNLEYVQLDFRKKSSQSSAQSSGDRSPDAIQVAFGPGPSVSVVISTDTSMVNYGELNFSAMEAWDELVNIVQHSCTSRGISVVKSDWLIWQISHLYWTSLPQTTLIFTHHTFMDLLSTPP